MTRTIAILAAGAAALSLAVAAYFVLTAAPKDKYAQCRVGKVGGAQQIGGPFTLVDENGTTVTDKDVITRPSLLYFGYTFCPDVCPLDNARNAEAVDLLDAQGHDVLPVFISIDPERDTPQAMKDFTDIVHPKMLGLTGSPEQTKAASVAYRTYFKRQESDDPEFYLVDHSTFSYLVMPDEGFVEFFRRDSSAEAMSQTISCFVEAYNS